MTESIRPIGAAHFNLRDLPTTRPDALNRLDELPSGDDEAGELSAFKVFDFATLDKIVESVLSPHTSLAEKHHALMRAHVSIAGLGILSPLATKLAEAIRGLVNTA